METPYEVLGVKEDAGDEAIKKAYLRKVREFPPERNAGEFRRIRKAYELIETDKKRREYRLFHREKPDVSVLLRQILRPGRPERPDAGTLIRTLTEGLAEHLSETHTDT
ncbi:J domain-containing protein [Methylocaldum gracile subsp. desertum]|uniref:J domain-containing protein n=1 Tax=Methylocaldum sp. GT1BW TaxID=3438964 RepID=UPI003DA0D461